MCLPEEFFTKKPERLNRWKCTGLSVDEATERLQNYHSTVRDIAKEVVDFIYENWSRSEISKLPDWAQTILKEEHEQTEVKASHYLYRCNNFYPSLTRPFILVMDIQFIDLLNDATASGTAKEIYQKCLSILYLKNPALFESVADEMTRSSNDRIFLSYCEKIILAGKNKPASKASRDPLPLFVGRPRFIYGKLSNEDKLVNIQEFFNKIYEAQSIKFHETDLANKLTKTLGAATKETACYCLNDLL